MQDFFCIGFIACQLIGDRDFENVSASALAELAALRPVRPNPLSLATAQDRAAEKALFARIGTAVAPFAVIDRRDQIDAAAKAIHRTFRLQEPESVEAADGAVAV